MNKWKRVIALVCVFVMLCIGPLSAFATTAEPAPSATVPQVEATPVAKDDKDQPESTTSEGTDNPEVSATPTSTPENSPETSATPTATPENSPEASATPTATPENSPEASATPTATSENSPEVTPTATPNVAKSRSNVASYARAVGVTKNVSVSLKVGETYTYRRTPETVLYGSICRHYITTFYPMAIYNNCYTDGLSSAEEARIGDFSYKSEKNSNNNGQGDTIVYSFTAKEAGTATFSLHFSYSYNLTGGYAYCIYGHYCEAPSDYNAYWDTINFTVTVEDESTYTVTYTDGVDGEVIFEDEVHSGLKQGENTPAFTGGTPTREGYDFKGWSPAVAETVTGNVTYVAQWEEKEEPAPDAPDADDLSNILGACVEVNCVGEDAHASRSYIPKSGDCEIGTVEKVDELWRVIVTMKADASGSYVESYSQDTGIAHSNEGLTDNTVTLYYRDGAWVKESSDVFKISAKCEAVYTIHVSFDQMSENNGDVSSTEPEQELTVSAPQAPEGSRFVGWSLNPSDGTVYTGKFNFADLSKQVGDNWTAGHEASITFYPVFEEIIPEAPGADDLSNILGECVVVNCTEGEHSSRTYAPNADDYKLGTVEKVDELWRVTVTMNATASAGYVAAYNEDVGIAHSDLGFSDNTVTLYYRDGAWVKDVADIFSISAKCEKVEEIRKITVGFAKDAGGEWGESGTVTSENPTQALTPADPTAPDGKVFKGWTLNSGSSEIYAGAFTFEALSQLIDDGAWYNNEAYLTFYPVFEDKPVQEKTITVFFTLTEGEWADDVPPDASKQFVLSSLAADAESNAPAAAVAPEGKQFVNWSSDHCDATLDAGEAFSFNSMMAYIDGFDADGNAYITLIAQYEEVPENKTLKIFWAIDNPDAAEWALGDDAAWTETIAWSDKDNTFVMPELNIKDGYELKGWAVSGTESNYWDASTSTFGLTGLIVEDDEGGYVSITANIVKVEEPVPETFTVTYTDGADGTVFADEITDGLLAGSDTPDFKGQLVRSGFVFAGWNPEVAETITANAVYTATWKVDSNNNGIADEDEETYTVTYTDGVSHREVFADQVYTGLLVGAKTPAFAGTPERDGYEFKGWKPAVAETVAGDAVYEAVWEQNPEDDDVPKTTDNLYPIQMTLLFGSLFCLMVAVFARMFCLIVVVIARIRNR